MQSIHSNTPTQVTFANESALDFEVYWIDYGGQEKLYRTLAPGESYTQNTFATHPWIVRERRSKIAVASLTADEAPRTLPITVGGAAHMISIAENGAPTPRHIDLNPGELVSFQVGSEPILLCPYPASVFGADRIEIPANGGVTLGVRLDAPTMSEFTYWSCRLDDETRVMSTEKVITEGRGDSGSGSVGGGG